MQTITLTAWEIAQTEAALRGRVKTLRLIGAEEDAINQTIALQERFAAAQSVTIEDPRS